MDPDHIAEIYCRRAESLQSTITNSKMNHMVSILLAVMTAIAGSSFLSLEMYLSIFITAFVSIGMILPVMFFTNFRLSRKQTELELRYLQFFAVGYIIEECRQKQSTALSDNDLDRVSNTMYRETMFNPHSLRMAVRACYDENFLRGGISLDPPDL